ncbi:phage integrase family protein [Mycobacteroides abscessus subsp. abscessus]|uniref:tyrosine-type recombinase/integrase n=1 Tax=Mycobacteroides abscessus TaxID=36809 RepID=UPI00092809F3|nr:site-specific integrase [Mycobacteroides abscessus]SIL49994.1 phage integrase family protein [Mycobacteroides abscessus subsp. abscessus]SLC74052.1 phage integrase family protein [Mycobacteroides abscessus subsp. abscessus]
MSNVAALPSPVPDRGKRSGHCDPGEYETFLVGSAWSAERKHRQLLYARRFAAAYPELDAWLQLPLGTRLGWRNNETQTRRTRGPLRSDVTTEWINFHARHYLIYLSLTGRLHLDWGWLLGIGVLKPWTVAESLGLPLVEQANALAAKHRELGLSERRCRYRVHWGVARLVLHRADPELSTLTTDDVEDLREAIRTAASIPGIPEVLGAKMQGTLTNFATRAFSTGVALYHAGMIDALPKRQVSQTRRPLSTVPRIAAVMNRYVAERSLIDSKASVDQARAALRRLSDWLSQERPAVESLAELKRPDLLDFLTWLQSQRKIKHPDQELSVPYRSMITWQINAFFRYGFNAEWGDMPTRPPLSTADVPRQVHKVPRYIPEQELEPLMERIRALECPLQRCSLLVARWSGARRTEIRKLHLDCLDTYPDGTHRIRLAAGKSRRERTVPIHPEAATAIEELAAIRRQQDDRAIFDQDLSRPVRRLFLHNGRLASPDYLFAFPLQRVCAEAGLLKDDGKAAVHAHRFRHTLGTELASKGAKTLTIMKILGHQSAGMSMTYAHISDPVVLADYKAVIEPGAILAGPQADVVRAGRLDQESLDWLKTNFYKTELELGHCLRLPQEGPCECDIYLTCPKFLTTKKYAPRLRERLCTERQLATDAEERGWAREVERHERTADRIRALLDELGESAETGSDTPD